MKILILLIVFVVVRHDAVLAQTIFSPGGVKAPIIWYKTDSTTIPTFHSLIGGTDSLISMPNAPSNTLMNFHPSLVFDGSDTLSIRLPDSSLTNATFFVAYQTKSTNTEGTVWHITKQNKTTTVFTSSRLADLETYQYMNYRDFVLGEPKINTYTQKKSKDVVFPIKQFWNIGFKPHSPKLPIFSFNGVIPEVIAYDRVLSTEERLRVGSYLAIKYGITLSDQNATYLNSKGDTVWNGIAYTNYYHNIAGIARDDSSHLTQPKSTSSNAPGLLTVAADSLLNNNASLIWGDNNKPLTDGDKIPGVPKVLKKQWLMFTHNNSQPLKTEVIVNTKQIDVPLPPNPVYWLVIDRSGKGDFSLPGIEFIKMSSIDTDRKVHFSNISWGINKNNTEVMSLAAAQGLLADITINNPLCNDQNGGSIQVKIIGGLAPFQLTLAKTTGETVYHEAFSDNTTETIKGLVASKYTLTLTDAAHTTYTDSFYLNYADGPKPLVVAANYTLPQSGALTIRADSGMAEGLFYEWNGPNGFHNSNPDVTITKPGTYTLKCSTEGCSYQQDVTVTGFPTGAFTNKNVLIYPNPSNGQFNASVSLDQPGAVKMSIYGPGGNPMGKPQKGTGMANYQFSGNIPLTGVYLVEFTSGKYVITKKLVVVN